MKNLFFLATAMIMSVAVQATPNAYKKSDLRKMSKVTLTDIYLNEVEKVITNIPYASFTLFGNNTTDLDSTAVNTRLDVPDSEYFNLKRNNTVVASVSYSDLVRKEVKEMIPYCDKEDIITSIIYLQNVNKNIKVQGADDNFVIQRLIY